MALRTRKTRLRDRWPAANQQSRRVLEVGSGTPPGEHPQCTSGYGLRLIKTTLSPLGPVQGNRHNQKPARQLGPKLLLNCSRKQGSQYPVYRANALVFKGVKNLTQRSIIAAERHCPFKGRRESPADSANLHLQILACKMAALHMLATSAASCPINAPDAGKTRDAGRNPRNI